MQCVAHDFSKARSYIFSLLDYVFEHLNCHYYSFLNPCVYGNYKSSYLRLLYFFKKNTGNYWKPNVVVLLYFLIYNS